MQSFIEFISEGYARGAGGPKNSKSLMLPTSKNPVAAGFNHADTTAEGLRITLLDIFWPKAEGDKQKETKINQYITTFVTAMSKKLRIDEDIIDGLAQMVKMKSDKVAKILQDELNKYYNSSTNIYGG